MEKFLAALTQYAERFHAALPPGHHVASPLGAWLVLALAATAGGADGELTEILGLEPADASAVAAALLEQPHPLVGAALAMWLAPGVDGAGLREWQATLPAATESGVLPDQPALDRWVKDRTLGLIDTFPIELTPDVRLVLAGALATKIGWTVPFDLAPAGALGPGSRWAATLTGVLRAPAGGSAHEAWIADTEAAGRVIVHSARVDHSSEDWRNTAGVRVLSVAAATGVDPGRVLAAAHELAPGEAGAGPDGRRVSLFDLPLGDHPLWTIHERVAERSGHEWITTILPAWSASNDYDLGTAPFGFEAAARVLAPLTGTDPGAFTARQAAVARYSRIGFEAAAVTGFDTLESIPPPGMDRFAELRFGHPYAVVAVALQRVSESEDVFPVHGPWNGVPVFSAWVSEPEDAE